MTQASDAQVREVLDMTIKQALAKLSEGLTPAEMDAAACLEKKIDRSAYRMDDESGNLLASKDEHRQVALAALSLAIDAMVNSRC